MHGIYFISILYAIFSLSLTFLQPIFWSSKKLFLCYHKAIVLERKQQKNSQENSLGDNQNFSKNSFKYSQLSISFK